MNFGTSYYCSKNTSTDRGCYLTDDGSRLVLLSPSFCGLMPNETWMSSPINTNIPTLNESTHNPFLIILAQPNSLHVSKIKPLPVLEERHKSQLLVIPPVNTRDTPSVPVSHESFHCHTVMHLARCETKPICYRRWRLSILPFCPTLGVCRLMGLTHSDQTNACLFWMRRVLFSCLIRITLNTETRLKCWNFSKQSWKVE